MKRLAFLATSALIAATAVSIGLIGNASFSEDVPVKVPSTATLLDNEGNAVSATRVAATEGGDDHAKPRIIIKRRIAERADDHGQKRRTDDRARADDHGRNGEAEPGEDHGGRRAVAIHDDNGGRHTTTATATSDDHGGRSGRSGSEAG